MITAFGRRHRLLYLLCAILLFSGCDGCDDDALGNIQLVTDAIRVVPKAVTQGVSGKCINPTHQQTFNATLDLKPGQAQPAPFGFTVSTPDITVTRGQSTVVDLTDPTTPNRPQNLIDRPRTVVTPFQFTCNKRGIEGTVQVTSPGVKAAVDSIRCLKGLKTSAAFSDEVDRLASGIGSGVGPNNLFIDAGNATLDTDPPTPNLTIMASELGTALLVFVPNQNPNVTDATGSASYRINCKTPGDTFANFRIDETWQELNCPVKCVEGVPGDDDEDQ